MENAGTAQKTDSGSTDLFWMAGVATCIKLLLIPAYHSTDFEVHRHWLAVTNSLPVSQWYLDETSEWTLDYPPFFAFFEWMLSHFARLVDPRSVNLNEGLNYNAYNFVVIHRASVMVSDGLMLLGLWRFCRSFPLNKQRFIYAAVLWSPGLLMVDHIHFQYNGFLLGMLLLSLSFINDEKYMAGGILFAVLLCFKHLFAVAGPVYFVYLLRHYCKDLVRFTMIGCSVAAVLFAAFGPFLYFGQIVQVLRRLFPFGRGLCHAYWAPNFWALYAAADKLAASFCTRLGYHIETQQATMTGGLVGDSKSLAVLPQVTPFITMLLVLLAMLPCLFKLWNGQMKCTFVRCVVFAYMCGFMFGWHVHEKASLHFVIPLSLISLNSKTDAQDYLFLSTVAYYSLFPLLFEAREYAIKVILVILYMLMMYLGFSAYFDVDNCEEQVKFEHSGPPEATMSKEDTKCSESLLWKMEIIYLSGLVCVEVYGQLIHSLLFKDSLPFLPLLVVSCYCALGMIYSWLKQLFYLWNS